MKAETRRKLSMAARALDFAAANPSDQASIKTVVARLDTLVDRADTLSVQERSGHVDQALAVAERQAARRTTRKDQLGQLVRIAASATTEHPELKGMFKLPQYKTANRNYLSAAKDMLASATAQRPLLDSLGLGETVIDDLTQGIAAIETATEQAHAARSAHIGASAQLDSVAADAVKVVGVLDALYQTRFKSNAEMLAAWSSASAVRAPGKKAAAPAPTPTPPTDGDDARRTT